MFPLKFRFIHFHTLYLISLVMVSCITCQYCFAQLEPAGVFGNNAIFQQKVKLPIWGKAKAKAIVTVSFAKYQKQVTADEKGNWTLFLPAMKADGKSHQLEIESEGRKIIFTNILLGEVWLASGQSNMAYLISSDLLNKETEIKNANYPDIRFRIVDNNTSIIPLDYMTSREWKVCNPQNVLDFSAVAYFFARSLHIDKKVPVGIIVSAKGATSIESWMSKESLLTQNEFKEGLQKRDEDSTHWKNFVINSNKANADRETIARTSFRGIDLGIHKVDFNDAEWRKTLFPLSSEKMGYPSFWGIIWIRKTFQISDLQATKSWILTLPLRDQNDIVYLNEKEIATGVSKAKSKSIDIPLNLLKSGKNILTIRMYVNWGIADVGDRTSNCFFKALDGDQIDLSGFWTHHNKIEPDVAQWQGYYNKETVNFNSMIYPLIPFSIKGFLWYQGENNTSKAKQYENLMPLMINNWRSLWQNAELPFLFVQLANYKQRSFVPLSNDAWAELRDAQQKTLKNTKHVAIASAIDIGDEFNIHPSNKQEVGRRLYEAAKEIAYKQQVVGMGPLFKDASFDGNKVVISFRNVPNGFVSKGSSLDSCFALLDENGKWSWTTAEVYGKKIVLNLKTIKKPTRIQYAWQSNPSAPLYNQEGLPMFPFNEKIND
jgi:sialate O-acetylesterase